MKTVLVVEDSEGMRRVLGRVLRKHAIVYEAAVSSALKALDQFPRFDAVVTDWNLPDGTGRRIVERCKVLGLRFRVHSGEIPEDDLYEEWIEKGDVATVLSFVDEKADLNWT